MKPDRRTDTGAAGGMGAAAIRGLRRVGNLRAGTARATKPRSRTKGSSVHLCLVMVPTTDWVDGGMAVGGGGEVMVRGQALRGLGRRRIGRVGRIGRERGS